MTSLTPALIFSLYANFFLSQDKYSHPSISVYKLVRFYQPSSAEQYETTRATLTIFSKPPNLPGIAKRLIFLILAISAFILLLATFAVGLRCFSDFDRGLQSSKVHCEHLYSVVRFQFSLTSTSYTRATIYLYTSLFWQHDPKAIEHSRSPIGSTYIHRIIISHLELESVFTAMITSP